MREVERRVVLSVLDRKWREHLYEMDYLQEGIGLRAMAQRDPLVEYQREGFQLFEAMNESIKEESVGYLFNVEVEVNEGEVAAAAATEIPDKEGEQLLPVAAAPPAEPVLRGRGLEAPKRADRLHYSAPSDDGSVQERDVVPEGQPASRAERRLSKKARKRGK